MATATGRRVPALSAVVALQSPAGRPTPHDEENAMTSQPPPEQEPTAGSQAFDPKSVDPLDWGILGAGVLAFFFSMFSYYTVKVAVDMPGMGDISNSASAGAWHGFFGWFAAVCALAGAALVALSLFAPQVTLPVSARLAAVGAFAVATLCVLVAFFVMPGGSASVDFPGIDVDEGRGIGYWLSLIVILGGLALSVVRLQQTGGKLPGQK